MDSKHQMGVVVGIMCTLGAGSARVASAQAPTDPCALLTPAQITAVVGASVGAGTAIGTTGCQWATTQANATTRPVTATVALWPVAAFAGMKADLPQVTKSSVSGIGEDAVWVTGGRLTTLSVKKGSVAFVIRLYGIQGQDKQMAMEKALAINVLAKL
jgi:hypothetical protein